MLTPATVIDRAAGAVRLASTNFSLSAGLPDRNLVGAAVDCAISRPLTAARP